MFYFGAVRAIVEHRRLANGFAEVGCEVFYQLEDAVKTVFSLFVASVVAGFSFTQTASAQYPGYVALPQYSTNYPYASPAGYYRPPHHHHHHNQVIVPNYTSLYGGNVGYAQQPVVVGTPSVYTTNNYYQAPRNHPWHLGHYLLGN